MSPRSFFSCNDVDYHRRVFLQHGSLLSLNCREMSLDYNLNFATIWPSKCHFYLYIEMVLSAFLSMNLPFTSCPLSRKDFWFCFCLLGQGVAFICLIIRQRSIRIIMIIIIFFFKIFNFFILYIDLFNFIIYFLCRNVTLQYSCYITGLFSCLSRWTEARTFAPGHTLSVISAPSWHLKNLDIF